MFSNTVSPFGSAFDDALHIFTVQRHKRDHSDSKISVVNSKGSRNNKQLEHSKIPIIASEKHEKMSEQKVGEKQAGTDGLKTDLMSDHISQLQKNQRDQSARYVSK